MQVWLKKVYHKFDLSFFSNISILATCLFVGVQTCTLKKQFESQLSKDRPFITVEPTYNTDKLGRIYRLNYIFVNYGNIPGRIICSIKKISFTETKTLNRSDKECDTSPRVIYPINNSKFSMIEIDLSSEYISDFSQGKGRVDMAACVVFKSINEKDTRAWIALVKHVFTGESSRFRAVNINELTVPHGHKTCDIDLPTGT